jgi:DNA-binding IclR family transcriptional regulator
LSNVTTDRKRYPSAIAVERAADILAMLGERGAVSVMDLAAQAGLSGSAVHRILTALKRKGLVEQDPASERYQLSWGVLTLARSLVNRDHVRSVALRYMTELRDLAGETVTLYVRSGFERICIEQVEGTQEIRYQAEIGRSLPLYAGASGLVLLAYMPDDELEDYLESVELQSMTPATIRDRAKLERLLRRIRKQGYASASNDRLLGLAGLSVPVLDGSGATSAAMTIAGPVERFAAADRERWIEALQEATSAIASVLRGRQPATATDGAQALDKLTRSGRDL